MPLVTNSGRPLSFSPATVATPSTVEALALIDGEGVEHLDEGLHGFDHFTFWWFVPDERVIPSLHRRTDQPRDDSALERWFKDEFLSVVLYRSLLAVGKRNRASFIPGINRFLTTEASRRFERNCQSTDGFLTPVPPRHREREWAFDLAQAKELLRAWRALLLALMHQHDPKQKFVNDLLRRASSVP